MGAAPPEEHYLRRAEVMMRAEGDFDLADYIRQVADANERGGDWLACEVPSRTLEPK